MPTRSDPESTHIGEFDSKSFLKQLTERPGVYRMYDEGGSVLYVRFTPCGADTSGCVDGVVFADIAAFVDRSVCAVRVDCAKCFLISNITTKAGTEYHNIEERLISDCAALTP